MLLYPMFAYAYYLKMGYQDKGHLFPVFMGREAYQIILWISAPINLYLHIPLLHSQ